ARHGHAQWFAGRPEADAAMAASQGQGQGHRGRHPRPWRYHAVRSAIVAATRRTRRPRRGRPATMAPPPMESGYRLVIEVEALANPEEDKGWTVLATTIDAEGWPDVDILQAYQDQNTTVEPGFRWIKNPAAIAPVWLEKPERIAALAMLTVLGLLVYSVVQRQVRLYLRTHAQQLPGNKGMTATPTAAVVLALFAQVALVQLWIDEQEVTQLSGVTSLRPERVTPGQLLAFVRGHWHIENKSHWVRDVTFDEDRSQVRCGNIPQVMAALRNTTIGVLRWAGHTNMAAACRQLAAQPAQALALIGIEFEN